MLYVARFNALRGLPPNVFDMTNRPDNFFTSSWDAIEREKN